MFYYNILSMKCKVQKINCFIRYLLSDKQIYFNRNLHNFYRDFYWCSRNCKWGDMLPSVEVMNTQDSQSNSSIHADQSEESFESTPNIITNQSNCVNNDLNDEMKFNELSNQETDQSNCSKSDSSKLNNTIVC